MNELNLKLAELALLNKSELPVNPSYSGTPGKKIGPAVPPKPKKQQPLIPQSYPLKQAVEPSYSSCLQNNQTHLYTNVPSIDQSNAYSNSQTMPFKTNQRENYMDSYANILPRENRSLNTGIRGYEKQPHGTYSNISVGSNRKTDGLIYTNIMHEPERGNIYSNLPRNTSHYANGENLPLPPPPLDLTATIDYASCALNTNFPPPPDDLIPPPSPVSSSYSELRRATQPDQDFNNYSIDSQSFSRCESIYEPINPRPQSQLSSRSNYSLYTPYVSRNSSDLVGPSQSAGRLELNKEQEVENLTDLLVHGMDNENDQEDMYGICVKCNEKILGANSGCTAMDQLYHTHCFTCHHCAINLQGKPFYALDGNPYCEEDYLNTLEKCCVCQKPILDRILRATGKPYHPCCFCCVVCGKSLDGIPFTVDATNQVHCIEDFHKKFAPRCWVCKKPIMPELDEEETVRVVALDHSFHIQCYKCEDCGLVLSSETEGRGCYPLDGHVLCKSCNAKRVQALTSHMTTEL